MILSRHVPFAPSSAASCLPSFLPCSPMATEESAEEAGVMRPLFRKRHFDGWDRGHRRATDRLRGLTVLQSDDETCVTAFRSERGKAYRRPARRGTR